MKLEAVDSEQSTQATWKPEEWQWDAYKMQARPVDDKAAKMTTRSRSMVSAGTSVHISSAQPDFSEDPPYSSRGRSKGPPVCQVEGCDVNLTGLKEYHQRYKICEHHLKVPELVRHDVRQRFCQQCGRFHHLVEFDGEKRSCRARLQRHNARRRKKEGDAPAKPAKRALSRAARGSPRQDSDSKRARESSEEDVAPALPKYMLRQQPELEAEHQQRQQQAQQQQQRQKHQQATMKAAEQQESIVRAAEQELAIRSAERQRQQQQETLEDSLRTGKSWGSRGGLQEMDDAMMELLQEPAGRQLQTGELNMQDMMTEEKMQTAEAVSFMNSWGANLDPPFFAEAPGAPNPSLSSSMGSSWARPQSGQPSQAGLDANVGLIPSLHFMAQPNAVPPYPSSMAQGHLGQGMFSQQPEVQAAQHLAQPMESRAPSGSSANYPAGSRLLSMESRGPSGFSNVYPGAIQGLAPTSQPLSVLDEARALLEYGTAQPTYVPEHQFTRMSAKLFNCTPSHLPPDLKQDLVDLLSCGINSVEGYIRPGCVHLVLGAIMSRAQYKQLATLDIRQAVEQLVTSSNKDFWSADTVLVQLRDEVALVKDGQVQHVLSGSGSRGIFPHMAEVAPIAANSMEPVKLTVTGTRITAEHNTVLARYRGTYIPVKVQAAGNVGSGSSWEQLIVRLPSGLPRGAVQLEVARGGYTSPAKPVLLIDDSEVVAEFQTLSGKARPGLDIDGLLLDFDRILEFDSMLSLKDAGAEGLARAYDKEDMQSVAASARSLLMFACTQGWAATARVVLPAACMDLGSAAAVVAALEEQLPRGMTLLILAVSSQCVELVDLLLTWGINRGIAWDAAAQGPRGITALHLAALQKDSAMADLLTDTSSGSFAAWTSLQAADGQTPHDYAAMDGSHVLNTFIEQKQAGELLEEEGAFAFDPETGELLEDFIGADGEALAVRSSSSTDSLMVPGQQQQEAAAGHDALPRALSSRAGSREGCPAAAQPIQKPSHATQFEAALMYHNTTAPTGAASEGLPQPAVPTPQVCQDPFEHTAQEFELSDKPKAARRKRAQNSDIDSDCYIDTGVRMAPTVFDRLSAGCSAGLIGAVGAFTLFLRHQVDFFMRTLVVPRAEFQLADLPYPLDALESKGMSKSTFEFHWGKHHRAYVTNLNGQIKGTDLEGKSLEEVTKATWNNGNPKPEFNNAAQSWNHEFFWNSMAPNGGGPPTGAIKDAIEKDFGGVEEFKKQFSQAGATQFGSGWAWLVLGSDGKLKVTKTPNAENPIANGSGTPLLTMDVWEHAYYLDVQNARPKYIQNFLEELISWDVVNKRLAEA